MKLSYTPQALAELEKVLSYLGEHSPSGAQNVRRRLQAVIGFIAQYPQAGTQLNGRGMRRIAAVPFPYLVFYRVQDGQVTIIGVRHAARKMSDLPRKA